LQKSVTSVFEWKKKKTVVTNSQFACSVGEEGWYKNSSEDEIANVNFFYDDIVHAEASAYAH